MTVDTSPVRGANSGLSAYERQRGFESSGSFVVPTGSKRRAFSLGPLTLRYEEEESFDFSALARAASAQLERVRRFNFAEALQSESARAEFFAGDGASSAPIAAPAKSGAAAENAARAAAISGLTYGADGCMRASRLYLPDAAEDKVATIENTAGFGPEILNGAGGAYMSSAARTRAALTAYLAADRAAFPGSVPGRLWSGAV